MTRPITTSVDPASDHALEKDWHDRYVGDVPLRYLLRWVGPQVDTPLWGMFLKKLRSHRHGLGTKAVVAAALFAALSGLLSSGVVSFPVWYLVFLGYLPLAAVYAVRATLATDVFEAYILAPGAERDFRRAQTAMVCLLMVTALIPAGSYLLVRYLAFGQGGLLVHEVCFILAAVAAMASATILAMRGFGFAVILIPCAVSAVALMMIFPTMSLDHLILGLSLPSHPASPWRPVSAMNRLLIAHAMFIFWLLWLQPLRRKS